MKITFQQLNELEGKLLQDRNRINWAMGSMKPSQKHYETDWELDELIRVYSPDLLKEVEE